jgi:hypothetical protein
LKMVQLLMKVSVLTTFLMVLANIIIKNHWLSGMKATLKMENLTALGA